MRLSARFYPYRRGAFVAPAPQDDTILNSKYQIPSNPNKSQIPIIQTLIFFPLFLFLFFLFDQWNLDFI